MEHISCCLPWAPKLLIMAVLQWEPLDIINVSLTFKFLLETFSNGKLLSSCFLTCGWFGHKRGTKQVGAFGTPKAAIFAVPGLKELKLFR